MMLPPPFRRKVHPPLGVDPTPLPIEVARWSDEYLFQRLAKAENSFIYGRLVMESELRIREAWRSPDSWAFAVSLVSLLVSTAALWISAAR